MTTVMSKQNVAYYLRSQQKLVSVAQVVVVSALVTTCTGPHLPRRLRATQLQPELQILSSLLLTPSAAERPSFDLNKNDKCETVTCVLLYNGRTHANVAFTTRKHVEHPIMQQRVKQCSHVTRVQKYLHTVSDIQ